MVQAPEAREEEQCHARREDDAGQPGEEAAMLGKDADEGIEKPEDRESRQHLPERNGQEGGDGGEKGKGL